MIGEASSVCAGLKAKGLAVGNAVGVGVGMAVGIAVGIAVSIAVGVAVGIGVGGSERMYDVHLEPSCLHRPKSQFRRRWQ